MTDFQTGLATTVRSLGWTIHGNVLAATGDARLVGHHLDEADWSVVRNSLTIADNRWHHATDTRPFTLPGRTMNFRDWREETGETGSSFATARPGLQGPRPRPRLG